jgi:hypothetical protein
LGLVAAVVRQPLCQEMLMADTAQLLYDHGDAPCPPHVHQFLQQPSKQQQNHKGQASCGYGCCGQLMALFLKAFH